MSISLLSGKAEPYGLLSSNAEVPMTIDGKQYSSVTEYIYKNLFTSEESKAIMKDRIYRNPYSSAAAIKRESNAKLYIDALVLGTKARYAQDLKFRQEIKSLGKSSIEVNWGTEDENRHLHMLFTQLRFSPENVFFDEKYGEVSFETVNSVVVGVANELFKNPNFQSKSFYDLLEYSDKNAPPRKDLVLALDNLDEIVPVLKIKLKKKIFGEEIKRFKTHLLDVSLDYILETNYSNLDQSQYGLAKLQQKTKERNLLRYEDDLYNLYKSGNLPNEIIQKLIFEPDVPSSDNVTIESIEEQEEQRDSGVPIEIESLNTRSINIPASLLPDAPCRIRIKGVEYTSVVAYAYSVLFNNIGVTVPAEILATDPLERIAMEYGRLEHDIMANRLSELNEKGTRAKFNSNPALIQLLLATNGNRLVFTDLDDPVLGIGKPMSPNRAGTFLEFLRNEYNPNSYPNVPFVTSHDNIVIKEWFISRAEDYANALKMFSIRTREDISKLYNTQPINIDMNTVSNASVELMNKAGLSVPDQRLILPFIVADFRKIQSGGIKGLCDSYDQNQPSANDRQMAEYILQEMFYSFKKNLYPDVTRLTFVSTILSNQPVYDVKQEQWWRINKWCLIAKLRA